MGVSAIIVFFSVLLIVEATNLDGEPGRCGYPDYYCPEFAPCCNIHGYCGSGDAYCARPVCLSGPCYEALIYRPKENHGSGGGRSGSRSESEDYLEIRLRQDDSDPRNSFRRESRSRREGRPFDEKKFELAAGKPVKSSTGRGSRYKKRSDSPERPNYYCRGRW